MNSLDSHILQTLAFFAIFGRPLTAAEVHKWLWQSPATLEQIMQRLPVLKAVQERDGYWYLRNQEYPDRPAQRELNAGLRSKAFRYLPMLRNVPGIRFCGIGNTLAFDAATDDSDIDLFIIARPGMLWFVRFACTMILHVQGVRRYGKKVAGRFCLSFFVDETVMDFSQIAIEEDVYLQYWIATLLPIFGQETWEAFQEANRAFVQLPNAFPAAPTAPAKHQEGTERFFVSWGRPLLQLIRWMQRKKMQHLPVKLGAGASVVVNDHMLKFHNNDRRAHFRDAWKLILDTRS